MPRGKRASAPEPVPENVSHADIGHNTLQSAGFRKHFREMRDIQRRIDDASAKVRSLGKEMKQAKDRAEADGLDMPAMKLLAFLSKLDDGEADSLLSNVFKYAGWLDLPIGTQVSLFDGEAGLDEDPDHWRWVANQSGIDAGKAGHPRDGNPHEAGTELYAEWDAGWLGGHEIATTAMGPGVEPAETTRTRIEPPTPTIDDGFAASAVAGHA